MPDRPALALPLVLLLAGCVAPAALDAGAVRDAPTLACGDACGVRIDATPGGGFEPHVATHPTDPDHVVVATRVTGRAEMPFPYVLWFDVHASRDGGRSWSVTSVRYTEPLGLRGGAEAQNVMGDPVLAFLPDGTLLLTGATLQYVALPAGGVMRDVRLFVTRSTDGGASFEPPVVVARSTGVVAFAAAPFPPLAAAALLDLPDKPWLATGPDGTALLTWTRFLGGHPESLGFRADVVLSVSRDGGRAWSAPRLVAMGGSLQGSAPVVGSDGAWHVAYVDMDTQRVRVAASRDAGATWTRADVLPGAWMPALAIDRRPEGDRLFLVSSPPVGEGREDDARQAVALTWSDDGGASWAAPLALDEPEAPGRNVPSVAVGPGGVAFVTYAHARGDDASSFHAVALGPDGWRADLTLDGSIAGPTWRLGDYLGVAAGPGGAFAVWSTTRDGREYDVVGARLRFA